MAFSVKTAILKLTAAIVIDGTIVRAGTLVEMAEGEAKDLLRRGKAELATERDNPTLRTDGPTVGEFVAAGYRAENYPPQGYASRSNDDEIQAAIDAQNAAAAAAAAAALAQAEAEAKARDEAAAKAKAEEDAHAAAEAEAKAKAAAAEAAAKPAATRKAK